MHKHLHSRKRHAMIKAKEGVLMKTIFYAGRQIPLWEQYDVIVVGGGTSGSAAAIASSKHGLHTLIVERSAKLGGTSVNGLVCPMMPSRVTHLSLFARTKQTKGL